MWQRRCQANCQHWDQDWDCSGMPCLSDAHMRHDDVHLWPGRRANPPSSSMAEALGDEMATWERACLPPQLRGASVGAPMALVLFAKMRRGSTAWGQRGSVTVLFGVTVGVGHGSELGGA